MPLKLGCREAQRKSPSFGCDLWTPYGAYRHSRLRAPTLITVDFASTTGGTLSTLFKRGRVGQNTSLQRFSRAHSGSASYFLPAVAHPPISTVAYVPCERSSTYVRTYNTNNELTLGFNIKQWAQCRLRSCVELWAVDERSASGGGYADVPTCPTRHAVDSGGREKRDGPREQEAAAVGGGQWTVAVGDETARRSRPCPVQGPRRLSLWKPAATTKTTTTHAGT